MTHLIGPRRGKRSRYGRYSGGPDPLAPPVDLTDALRDIANDIMAGYSPEQALREYLRRGAQGQDGFDELARKAAQRRKELLERNNLGGTLQEVKALLDDTLRLERAQLARDIDLDDTDRAFREIQLENLPESTPAAVSELNNYDWQSTDAREKFEHIRDLLGREMLDQQFAGMKQALEGATEEDKAAVAEMLRDLNDLLNKHREGIDTPTDFANFMAKHGEQFPESPRDINELIDILSQRSAATQRMLNSMSEEQRNELMQLSSQAFGSSELQGLMGELAGNLRGLRPDLDWSGSEEFTGEEGMGLGDGTGAMQNLAELDRLAEQLRHDHTDLDLDALRRQLGDDAAVSAELLDKIDRAMRESGMLRRSADGSLKLSPQAMRRLGKALLEDATELLSPRSGSRDSRLSGASGEQTGATRPYEYGDTQPWDVMRTITNAIQRTAGTDEPLKLTPNDIEVVETEQRTQNAVALLVDTSYSMAAEGRWVPMKQTALALHHLITTRFRGDELALITFGRTAMTTDIEELTALPPVQEQGTNLHHALLLAERFFARHPSMQPTLLVVTDGEPTAYLQPDGHAWFNWPTDQHTMFSTVTQLDKVTKRGTRTTFFRLGHDYGLQHFLNQLADRVGGKVVAPDLDGLGAAVVDEYLNYRF
ncbi:VWA domain-containing protein [Corynebacterium sp.]|uniref:VWA domain-containing protein n=1 Tax=Corynebacterium sp. TaxID=1720 RepID=UPI0028AA625A|nr:VWA domain-containing protein [Corynebacterium sp.]